MLLSFFTAQALWACASCTGAESTMSHAIAQPVGKGYPPNRETELMILTPPVGV